MATLSTVNVKITGDTGQLVSSLTVAEGRVNKFASSVTKLDRTFGNQARGFSNLARGFTNAAGQSGVLNSEISILASSVGNIGLATAAAGIGLGALAGGLAVSIASAISFEAAITKVAKTADFSAEETKAFGDAILEMSRRLPVATRSLTEIAVVAGQLGITGTANIAKFVEEVAKLESTTGVAASELATGLGTLIQVSGLPIDAIDNISASITNLGNTSNSTEQQILDFGTRLVGVGTALGVPLADILSIGSSFAAAGVQAERGGTAIQNILIAISSAAEKGGDELQLFADVAGVTAEEFKRLTETDPGIAFGKFVEGLADIKNAIPVLEALEIADARIVASALSAANAQAGIVGPLLENRNAAIAATATNDEFGRSSATTAAKLQILKNNLNAAAIETGQVFQPALDTSLDAINNWIDGLDEGNRAVGLITESIDGWGLALNRLEGPINRVTSLLAESARGWGLALDFVLDQIDRIPNVDLTGGGGSPGFDSSLNLDRDLPGGQVFRDQFGNRINLDPSQSTDIPRPVGERDIPIPSGLLPKGGGGGGGGGLTLAGALGDSIISLAEAIELGLTNAQVIALELASAEDQAAAAAFRTNIELNKLAQLFPGLTGEQIQFALALGAIEQNLRETNRTAEQFRLAEAVGPELDRLESRLQEVLGSPTRETLQLQRRRAELDKRRLLILQGGATNDDARVKAIDTEIAGLNNLIRLRETEVDIMRLDAQLADQRTLSDAAQVQQTGLLTAATSFVSSEFNHLQGAAYLAAIALERVGAAGGVQPLSLRDALIALGNLPDKGASLIPQLGQGGTVLRTGLAVVDKGERFFNNGFGPRGESGVTNFNETTQIYVTANTKNDAEAIADVVVERLARRQRAADRRGAFVTTGGGFP